MSARRAADDGLGANDASPAEDVPEDAERDHDECDDAELELHPVWMFREREPGGLLWSVSVLRLAPHTVKGQEPHAQRAEPLEPLRRFTDLCRSLR